MTRDPAEVETGPALSAEPGRAGALRALWPHVRPFRRPLGFAVAVSVLATGALVAVPLMIALATDAATAGDRTGLLVGAGLAVVLAVVRLFAFRAAELMLAMTGERLVRALRELVVERLAKVPLRFLETHRGGDLLTRATTELENLATFVRAHLADFLTAVGYLVIAVITLLFYSPLLTLVLLVCFIPGALWVLRSFERASGAAWGAEADRQAELGAVFTESIDAAETLQMTGGAAVWAQRARGANAGWLDAVRRTVLALNRMPGLVVFEAVATAALLVVGAWLIGQGTIGLGTVVLFVLSSRNLFDSFLQLTELTAAVQESRTTLARLIDLLRVTEPGPTPPARDLPARGELTADAVTFDYTGQTVLHEVTVTVAAGERVALVGPTGAGKTTLAKLFCGLYRPTAGTVRYAGVPLSELDPGQVRQLLALVPQRVHLIAGSLLDNLLLVPGEPDRDRVTAAVAALGLDPWVAGLPDGLDSDVGNRGDRLSTGEQQLVGLVRAALVNPAVLILDEATADIDPVTAGRLETAIDRLCADRTLIVVAHRPDTITRLDRSVQVVDGRIVVAR